MKKADEEYIKKLGKSIKNRREALDYTLIQFANKADLSKGQLFKIEGGQNATTITVLRRIAMALDISLSELVDL